MRGTERLTEAEFTRQVIDLARLYGWRTAHFRPAQRRDGRWLTPVAGDGKGFPDLVLLHPIRGRLLFIELKVGKNRLTDEQALWLSDLRGLLGAGNAEEWRPERWDYIEATLRGDYD